MIRTLWKTLDKNYST